MLPGRNSGFLTGFRPDSSRESIKIYQAGYKVNNRRARPFEFMGLWAMDLPKPYKCVYGFSNIYDTKPYKFIGFRWALIRHQMVERCQDFVDFRSQGGGPATLCYTMVLPGQKNKHPGLISAGFFSGTRQNRPGPILRHSRLESG